RDPWQEGHSLCSISSVETSLRERPLPPRFALLFTSIVPLPSHRGHAPCFVLNENQRGSSSGMARPQVSHALCVPYRLISPRSFSILILPPPQLKARSSTSSSSRRKGTISWITRSMWCSFERASFGGEAVSTRVPSHSAVVMPSRSAPLNTSRYVPLRPSTTGARTVPRPGSFLS